MAALADDAHLNSISLGQKRIESFIVENGDTVFKGALVCVDQGSGFIRPMLDSSNEIFVGIAEEQVVGDGSLRCMVNCGTIMLPNAAITLTSAAADNYRAVYTTTDNIADLTVTRPGDDAQAIGYVQRFISTSAGDVVLFGRPEALALGFSGGNKVTECLGSIDLTAAATTSGADLKTDMPQFGRFKIVDFFAIVKTPTTDAAADIVISLEINSVAVTGGAITIADTGETGAAGDIDTLGAKLSASAITAANEVHDGDNLSVVYADGLAAYASGEIDLYIVKEYYPGA